jgi:cytochrome c oxidase subunit IV
MDAPFEYPEYIEHHVPKSVYFVVFGALMVLTAVTVGVAFVDLGRMNVVVALVVALLKATLVVLFFMHVRYSSRLVQLVVISCTSATARASCSWSSSRPSCGW